MSVDVYTTPQPADQANQALLDSFVAAIETQTDAQRGDVQPMGLAGQTGPAREYSYTNADGLRSSGLVVAVTSPNTGLSYLVLVQAPEAEFQKHSTAFEVMLATLVIE